MFIIKSETEYKITGYEDTLLEDNKPWTLDWNIKLWTISNSDENGTKKINFERKMNEISWMTKCEWMNE